MSATLKLVSPPANANQASPTNEIDKLVTLLRWVTRDGMLPADATVISQLAKVDIAGAEAAMARMEEQGVRRVILGSEPHYIFTSQPKQNLVQTGLTLVAQNQTAVAEEASTQHTKDVQDVYDSLNEDMDAERALLWKIAIVCGGIAAATLIRQLAAIWVMG